MRWPPTRVRIAAALALAAVILATFLAITRAGFGTSTHSAKAARAPSTSGHPAALTPSGTAVQPSPSAADSAAVQRVLSYLSHIGSGGRERREVALTFDAGPAPVTPRTFAILRQEHAPATFFLIGRSAHAYPRMVRAEARAGFAIGNHTENHPSLRQLPAREQAQEIDHASNAVRSAGAPYPELFRPPYGSIDATTLSLLGARRMLAVLWSVDTRDYTRPGASRIFNAAVGGAQPGAIILMHDGGGDRSETVAALPNIISVLRLRGYRLVTIPKLLADDPPPHTPVRRSKGLDLTRSLALSNGGKAPDPAL